MKTRCWLIGEPGRRLSSQLQAASRGLALEIRGFDALSNISRAAGTLIALDFDCLQRLAPGARANLSEQIKAGATCYVGGGLPAGAHYSLEPLASVDFQVAVSYPSQGYTLTAQPLLPAALRGELVDGSYNIPVARGLSELAQRRLRRGRGCRQSLVLVPAALTRKRIPAAGNCGSTRRLRPRRRTRSGAAAWL